MAKEERVVCAHCSKKIYKKYSLLVFIHPVLNKAGVYACKYNYSIGRRRRSRYSDDGNTPESDCLKAVKAEVAMYHNTGMYSVMPDTTGLLMPKLSKAGAQRAKVLIKKNS